MAPSIAVAGAGLSGLLLAHRLVRAGVDVHVYERDEAPFTRPQGYRITVDADGLRALRTALPDELRAQILSTGGTPGGSFRFTNSRLRDAFTLTFKAEADGGRQIDRQVLRSALLNGLPERVHFGRAVSHIDGHDVHFDDGSHVHADVIVGADGVGSALRRQIAPGAEPRDSGMAGIYGRSPIPDLPDALRKSGVLAIGDRPASAFFFTSMRYATPPVGLVPDPRDYVMWGVVVRRTEVTDAPLQQQAVDQVRDYHPLIRSLVATADPAAIVLASFAVGCRPVRWPLPHATLTGDAIHVMPPFGAHGGNTALRDAGLLGDRLAGGGRPEAAIAAYQRDMVDYAFRDVDRAAAMMRRMTDSGAVGRFVLTRLLPSLHRHTVPAG
ncbi:FAD-dependent oxidoreductase [Mangrovihabitans endophyticus]|uniref:Monooxygenase n=1 Tax=Mangrovihabitans endophyticus TaxID=1751298 RepID=A0A8J3BY14_9ACTN|nr:NAD(P)/FAD-dependent oxidoreductase [Mangrovihabitans endophyticus]GGK81836.1 monooxygenase [Mangrovihabitans endophyticus]